MASTLVKPAFTLVSSTIIDAVAALFFFQSNKARQLMAEFFDKLRTDRRLDEALKLANEITDPVIASNFRALLSINFADIKANLHLFESVIARQETPAHNDQEAALEREETLEPSEVQTAAPSYKDESADEISQRMRKMKTNRPSGAPKRGAAMES